MKYFVQEKTNNNYSSTLFERHFKKTQKVDVFKMHKHFGAKTPTTFFGSRQWKVCI